jgi:hypothetical protein
MAHQLLIYADDVNMLGGSIHTIKENAETLVVASKETESQHMRCKFPKPENSDLGLDYVVIAL